MDNIIKVYEETGRPFPIDDTPLLIMKKIAEKIDNAIGVDEEAVVQDIGSIEWDKSLNENIKNLDYIIVKGLTKSIIKITEQPSE